MEITRINYGQEKTKILKSIRDSSFVGKYVDLLKIKQCQSSFNSRPSCTFYQSQLSIFLQCYCYSVSRLMIMMSYFDEGVHECSKQKPKTMKTSLGKSSICTPPPFFFLMADCSNLNLRLLIDYCHDCIYYFILLALGPFRVSEPCERFFYFAFKTVSHNFFIYTQLKRCFRKLPAKFYYIPMFLGRDMGS